MKLNIFRFLVIAFLITTAVLVPHRAAAAQVNDPCEWIKKVQNGKVAWATWDSATKTITFVDILAAPEGEGANVLREVRGQKFTMHRNGEGKMTWKAPDNWGGCGSDAGGGQFSQAINPTNPTTMLIVSAMVIVGLTGIGLWGLEHRRRGAQA